MKPGEYIIEAARKQAEGEIAVRGSGFITLVGLIWASLVPETWYREENWLRYKWGQYNYKSTQVPRPSFEGIIDVSDLTGDIIETYSSYIRYYGKILFSLSTMLCLLAAVVGVVIGIWTLQEIWGENDTRISITIGIINAIQIQIFNFFYTYLAVILNDYEGHRLEQDYYNHLVIKRIFFFIVNSFNSLVYISFFKSGYNNDEQRLKDVRTQLLTLFFTSIAIQNTFEVIIPLFCAKFITKIEICQSAMFEKQSSYVLYTFYNL